MRLHIHAFDARAGGQFRISLAYLDADHPQPGKTTGNPPTSRIERTYISDTLNETSANSTPCRCVLGEIKIRGRLAIGANGPRY